MKHADHDLTRRSCSPGTVAAQSRRNLIGHTAAPSRSQRSRVRRHTDRTDPASSGNTIRHRLHRGGDRQLNPGATHDRALQARTDPLTRAYLDRRAAEGKTKLEALRCLKRHLARHFWKLLYKTRK